VVVFDDFACRWPRTAWRRRHEAIAVSFGGNANAKHITTYFGARYNPAISAASVSVCSAMTVPWSTERCRGLSHNPLAGTITSTTPHRRQSVGRMNGIRVCRDFLSRRVGLNAIAVEVHQSDPTSSDLSFDLSCWRPVGDVDARSAPANGTDQHRGALENHRRRGRPRSTDNLRRCVGSVEDASARTEHEAADRCAGHDLLLLGRHACGANDRGCHVPLRTPPVAHRAAGAHLAIGDPEGGAGGPCATHSVAFTGCAAPICG
jgi:hypothetical protein